MSEKNGHKDALLLAMKMEEGAMGQGRGALLETGKGKKTDFPQELSERNTALPTP